MGLTATFPETGPAGSDETPKFIVDQGFYAADPNYYGYYCTGRKMGYGGLLEFYAIFCILLCLKMWGISVIHV